MLDYQSPAHAFAPPLPGYAEMHSERMARQIRLFEINAKERSERAKAGRLTLFAVLGVLVGLFLAGYAGAALTAQGYENITNWRIAHVQP